MAVENAPPEGLPLLSLADDGRVLDPAAFAAKHGDAFLVHEGPLQARRPMHPQATVMLEKFDFSRAPAPPVPGPAPVLERLVFPIHSTGRSPYPSMVTVGRTRNNDIVVPDVAISKFHAFFKLEEGRVLVHDAGSRNGTWLDGAAVPDSKKGKPMEVKFRSRVRFGEIEFHFMTGAQLHELVGLLLKP